MINKILVSTVCYEPKHMAVFFSLPSNGYSGPEWVEYFDENGVESSAIPKSILLSKSFIPTKGKIYNIVVTNGGTEFQENRMTSKLMEEATKRKYSELNAEATCLIRKSFTNEKICKMGFSSIIGMHKPIIYSGLPYLLGMNSDKSNPKLRAYYSNPRFWWYLKCGYAFENEK